MKKITIEVVCNVSGHGNIGIIPTNFSQWTINGSDSRDFNLDPGNYSINYLIATDKDAGGGSVTVIEDGKDLGKATFAPGVAGGTINITVV